MVFLTFSSYLYSGSVKVWDPRQKDVPVANMESSDQDLKRDCWCVAFGESSQSYSSIIETFLF